MLVQVSHAMPSFGLNVPAPAPAPNDISQPPTTSNSNASGNDSSELPKLILPTNLRPNSPEFAFYKQLIESFNTIFRTYGYGPLTMDDGKSDRMGNLGDAVNDSSPNIAPLSLLQSPPATQPPKSQPKEEKKEEKREQPKEVKKEQSREQPKQEQPKEQPKQQPENGSDDEDCSVGNAKNFDTKKFLDIINRKRAENGLNPVKLNKALCRDARDHAERMNRENDLTHDRAPENDISKKMTEYGYKPQGIVSENIVVGALNEQDIANSWFGSPEHNENIMRPGNKVMGVALVNNYASQEFSG
ncbi:hypothetical protein CONCODRAFT_71796 [Conidiobolus coronatus NRRL 28638]|uniref:SCP domain-containing protein n=1 Tax=Conidiobolus coronatus (strain ATCC 28846 / CBS 209.66 / NRRL 28638) TaxID=796925 RepID=A0A137P223_CONC2|nr:hypothetical protein CONCODRAFT_71796 [Conidiobolus coronatus NRRL 28638]|eukprot:KXN69018.1 hypothetical protein CONCODRAFT_71796 [Conidiobolus coronatus NRRL 28638]